MYRLVVVQDVVHVQDFVQCLYPWSIPLVYTSSIQVLVYPLSLLCISVVYPLSLLEWKIWEYIQSIDMLFPIYLPPIYLLYIYLSPIYIYLPIYLSIYIN